MSSDSPTVLSYHRAAGDAPDDCYRCGYPLLGIADQQPCPECGLLARRSRRASDELHNTRPRWLARISRRANLILLSILIAAAWPFLWEPFFARSYWSWRRSPLGFTLPMLGLDIAAILLLVGAWLLTSPERYPPADSADRRLRLALRLSAAVPLLAVVIGSPRAWSLYRIGIRSAFLSDWQMLELAIWILCSVGLIPLPLLLFAQLRGLAKRARSAHLAEHCAIVGIGTSSALLLLGVYTVLSHNAARWGLGTWWTTRSTVSLLLVLAIAVAACLFTLWSLYLFIRFALAFRRAARQLRGQWLRDDRSLPEAEVAAR